MRVDLSGGIWYFAFSRNCTQSTVRTERLHHMKTGKNRELRRQAAIAAREASKQERMRKPSGDSAYAQKIRRREAERRSHPEMAVAVERPATLESTTRPFSRDAALTGFGSNAEQRRPYSFFGFW
jgi:hypothetical protein